MNLASNRMAHKTPMKTALFPLTLDPETRMAEPWQLEALQSRKRPLRTLDDSILFTAL